MVRHNQNNNHKSHEKNYCTAAAASVFIIRPL
jgi:hypothetical protein